MERKIQKEREMEGGEFDHKEAFVTSAYKKKLQERAEEEERERRQAALEGEINTEPAYLLKRSMALYMFTALSSGLSVRLDIVSISKRSR